MSLSMRAGNTPQKLCSRLLPTYLPLSRTSLRLSGFAHFTITPHIPRIRPVQREDKK
jgi:hypothetical protein